MDATLSSKVEFKKFCRLLETITKSATSKKVQILERFFTQCRSVGKTLKEEFPDADISMFPILRLLLPQLERERGPNNLKQKSLANLYIRIFYLGKKSREADKLINYRAPRTGKSTATDFAEIVQEVVRNRLKQEGANFTIERINIFLDSISKSDESVQFKDKIFRELLHDASALELKWITRIVLKDLRLGISQKKILQAFHRHAVELFDQVGDLRQICERLHDPVAKKEISIQTFYHFKPMLLERCNIENLEKLFHHNDQYFVQMKLDGERSQLHMSDGIFKYFTRKGFDISNNPCYGKDCSSGGFLTSKIASLLSPNCESIILDGELMGWHKRKKMFGSKGMSYDVKKLILTSAHQPCFVAFDIIMYNDESLIKKPYRERLKILADAFKEEEGVLMKCKTNTVSNIDELQGTFHESIDRGEEGIVLKKCDGIYKPNVREGSGWYKIKAEYSSDLVQDLDLIILGGYYGEGKFMGTISSFMMGVACASEIEDGNPSGFLCVSSVSSGISHSDLVRLQKKFQPYWTKERPTGVTGPKSDPPNLWIRPQDSLILTVRATELVKTVSYPTGYSLRFPRVTRIRQDKPWYDACTIKEFLSLVKGKGIIHKLTKRSAVDEEDDDELEEPAPKIRKSKSYSKPFFSKISERSVKQCDVEIKPISRLLNEKEICVINGDNEMSKKDIETILLQHRARIVQNPRKETFCVITGNPKTAKAKNIIHCRTYDVVTIDWLKRVTRQENWSSLKDFLPWELLSNRESTRRRITENYDQFYDHFIVDADEETLKRSLEKAEEAIEETDFGDNYQMNEVDVEMFEDGVPPFSVFRSVTGYFEDPSDFSKYKFRFLGGSTKEILDDSVTHIFVKEGAWPSRPSLSTRDNTDKMMRKDLRTVSSKWIEDCFQNQRLLPVTKYFM